MREEEVEQYLQELKGKMNVNHTLKNQLRQELSIKIKQTKRRKWRPAGFVAAVLAIAVFGMVWLVQSPSVEKVAAAELNVQRSYSLLEQLGKEESTGIAEYEGVMYVAIPGEGLFRSDRNSYTKLVSGNISTVRIAPDGKQLVYVNDGSLYLYHLSEQKEMLLKEKTAGKRMDTPVWSPKGTHLLYVENEEGEAEAEGQIYELHMATGHTVAAAIGRYPGYLNGKKEIVFEHNGQIVGMKLDQDQSSPAEQSGAGQVVYAQGHSPAVSPDGRYIAYIQQNNGLEDVWIADSDWQTKQQVSNNIMSDAWDRETGELIEGKQQPKYEFVAPVWSSDGEKLLVYKVFRTNTIWKKLTSFEVRQEMLTAEQVVGSMIEALIYRDEDLAHTYFSYDPGYLKGTSPRQVGYRIIAAGEQNGRIYVDAETYLSYHEPFYQIEPARYWLSDQGGGYKIDAMDAQESRYITLSADGAVQIEHGDKSENLFEYAEKDKLKDAQDDIESDAQNDTGIGMISSFSFDTIQQQLYFTVAKQAIQQSEIVLAKYNVTNKTFEQLSSFETDAEGQTSLLLVDNTKRFAAMEVTVAGKPDIIVYDMEKKISYLLSEQIDIQGSELLGLHTRFWSEGKLVYYAEMNERTVFFNFYPEKK